MIRLLACAVFCLVPTLTARAQSSRYNPYAPPEKIEPVVTPEGKINWPSFFKSASLANRFNGYFQIGACVGTNESINERLRQNEVNINELPKSSVDGFAVAVQPGVVKMVDESGQPLGLLTHPMGVSRVSVTGTMPASQLRVGMAVRFQSSVDEHGMGLTPLSALDVVSANTDVEPKPVERNHVQTIVGTISRRLNRDRFQVQVQPGKLHRLTVTLATDVVVHVDAKTIDLIGPGDRLHAEGHLYTGAGSVTARTIFASKINATKSDGHEAKPEAALSAASTP